jgi:uncharacterized membrane protein
VVDENACLVGCMRFRYWFVVGVFVVGFVLVCLGLYYTSIAGDSELGHELLLAGGALWAVLLAIGFLYAARVAIESTRRRPFLRTLLSLMWISIVLSFHGTVQSILRSPVRIWHVLSQSFSLHSANLSLLVWLKFG